MLKVQLTEMHAALIIIIIIITIIIGISYMQGIYTYSPEKKPSP
jgi:hypothetical protein